MPYYIEDMMHCQQRKCNKREECYRYWLGQHAKGLVTMYMPKEEVTNGCDYYLDIKDY